MPPTAEPRAGFIGPAVLILALVAYVLAGLIGVAAHTDPSEMDTVSYLSAALKIKETGGWARFIPNCLTGVYQEGTRHPLYLLMLSVFAEPRTAFFVHAKLLTFAVGAAFVIMFFETARRWTGEAAAALAVALVVFNATFLRLTTMVASESLTALFFIPFWFWTIKGFEHRKAWPAAGAAAGLAFLSKSLGVLTLPIFLLSVLWVRRGKWRGLLTDRAFWGFFLIFALVASPLLARNVKLHGMPFYSDSVAVLWLDSWRDHHKYREGGRKASPAEFVRENGPAKTARIFAEGLWVRDRRMIADGLKPFRFWGKVDDDTLRGYQKRTIARQEAWAAALALFFLYGLWRVRARPEAAVVIVSLLVFLPFAGWFSKVFPATLPTRILYPLFFIILLYAAAGMTALLRGFARHMPRAAAGFLALYIACLGFNYDWRGLDVARSYHFGSIFPHQVAWVAARTRPGDRILVGQVFMRYWFYVKERLIGQKGITVEEWPDVGNMGDLTRFIRDRGFDYGILDLATVAFYNHLFDAHFVYNPQTGLRAKAPLPPPFKRVGGGIDRIPVYEIYEFR